MSVKRKIKEIPMPDVSVNGKLPAGDRNGLSAQVPELLADPKKVRVALVLYDVSKVTTEIGTDDKVPTVRIRGFEPITPTDDAEEMRRLLRRSVERRTGKMELPLDLERELDRLGQSLTGEGNGGDDTGNGHAESGDAAAPDADLGGSRDEPDDL